jgi:hypothetical protein
MCIEQQQQHLNLQKAEIGALMMSLEESENKPIWKSVIIVPDMETGCCLGSEKNGISVGEGSEGQPEPPERGKDGAVDAQQRQGQHGEG